ncbi:HotDog domain-containing protein [Cantharellus anzutake]|uniref:HotDog domain-containing protein n=1 Tax=Cantharellus anzutake TaxID=1750568 RepID=UPI0019048D32|nr:HotDog domain-containing protein [Cantharellus anzutake]KAF8339015.1 HotDog domain-containing protein [Cantharellus anzutake]
MAPNKFDIHRTPGQKPGLNQGDTPSDLSNINTNVPKRQLEGAMLTFDSFVRNGKYFGVEAVGKHLVSTDMSFGDEEDKPDVPDDKNKHSRMKFAANIDVSKDMCNKFGIMHGACVAYLMDTVTTGALVSLEGPPRVSLSLNISFYRPIPVGSKIRLVAYTTSVGRSIAHTRGEMWDLKKSTLLASCTHTMVDPKSDNPPPIAKSKL